MSEQLYTIKESTLTDIGNALRRRHGETKIGTVIVEEVVPAVIVSKTPNATGFDSYDGGYGNNNQLVDIIKIPNAQSIKIKIAYSTEAFSDRICIAGKEYKTPLEFTEYEQMLQGESNGIKEYTINNTDVVSILFSSDSGGSDYLGYYAEIRGLDENGNELGEQTVTVEKEAEVLNTFSSDKMAQVIDDIPQAPPDEAFLVTGNCMYRFSSGGWDWFINQYGDKITTKSVNNATYMFKDCLASSIPFDINLHQDTSNFSRMFAGCSNLTLAPSIKLNLVNSVGTGSGVDFSSICDSCRNLRDAENIFNHNELDILSSIKVTSSYSCPNYGYLFSGCFSLRQVPSWFYKLRISDESTAYPAAAKHLYLYTFDNCYSLDEINDLPVLLTQGEQTANMFGNLNNKCGRLKNLTFEKNEDGTPKVVKWKSQIMDLTQYVGYAFVKTNVTGYNSGIAKDKEVTDDATYQALKNDPDWYTGNVNYSRYNHYSAVSTINSLPDTSAYLAASGGTNTIKFKGDAGSLTDGGAISELTEEEIAVATARGWTVTLV